ncbi:crossover junction endodeoxyribonuclease RuvC [Patescibacteria group bacterium]|nr:MAG: crossover junction endodeoxyribonuclease RuvC [Patescibacteria group bacterium]
MTTCRVLGIDPGTATTGWAVVEEKKGVVKPVAFGHISTSPKRSDAERLAEIASDLGRIIRKYRPAEAAIEEIFFQNNVKTAVVVSQARGAILLTLEQNGVIISGYTPLQVKQAITGYGRAEKQQMQAMVKSILKLPSIPKPDDTADALAIALCHLNSRTMRGVKSRK